MKCPCESIGDLLKLAGVGSIGTQPGQCLSAKHPSRRACVSVGAQVLKVAVHENASSCQIAMNDRPRHADIAQADRARAGRVEGVTNGVGRIAIVRALRWRGGSRHVHREHEPVPRLERDVQYGAQANICDEDVLDLRGCELGEGVELVARLHGELKPRRLSRWRRARWRGW